MEGMLLAGLLCVFLQSRLASDNSGGTSRLSIFRYIVQQCTQAPGELIGIGGVVLGVLLGFLGQLVLARRQESQRLDQARRELYAAYLSATQHALNTLAEGAVNRVNSAIERGAYGSRFLEDHERLQAAISGMELISKPTVLATAKKFREAHWELAQAEANAAPVDRNVVRDEAAAILASVMQKLNALSNMNSTFIAAAQKELRISSLVTDRKHRSGS